MTLLTWTTGLWLAAATVPPLLLLYFLRLRRRTQPIATTLLWQRSVEDLRANAPFQRLRPSVLLFLQLLALTLIVLAIMQPQFQGSGRPDRRTVLLIDNSASMGATDEVDGRTRLEEAKRRARALVDDLYGGGFLARPSAETMVVAFNGRSEIQARFSRSRQDLLRAIDRIELSDGETRLDEPLDLARAFTTNVDPESERPVGDAATLELFSDGCIVDLPDQVLRGESLVYHRVGQVEAANVAVASISAQRPYDRPSAVQVFAAFVNHGVETVRCDVQLSVDGAARAIEALELSGRTTDEATGAVLPGRSQIVFTPFELARGAVVEIAHLHSDALPSDDRALVIVAPPRRLRAALVSSGRALVETALAGLPLESMDLLDLATFDALRADGGLGLDRYDVIVFDGAVPEGPLPAGRYLALGPAPIVDGLAAYGKSGPQVVLNVRDEHPVMRYVDLDRLFVSAAQLVEPSSDARVLATGSAGPLVIAIERGGMHLVYVAFDPVASNWPFQRSFVTFLYNAVDYLGHAGTGVTTEALRPGDALVARIPRSAADVTLVEPSGREHRIAPGDDGHLSWGPIRRAGLYDLRWMAPGATEPDHRAYAVNLLDESESAIAARETIEIGSERVTGERGQAASATALWPWALAACLAVLAAEWWVYHRKLI